MKKILKNEPRPDIRPPETLTGKAEAMTQTADSFALAGEDLPLRGPGEFYDTRQSALPEFKIADLPRDWKTLQAAREEALPWPKEAPYFKKPVYNEVYKTKMLQMLSNIEVILLSIVNEKPSYAYEIDKIIDFRDMRRRVRVGVASIYQALKKLEEKGLVYSQTEKGGRMPDRKRYYITDAGKAALVETSKKLLSSLEWYYLDLNVGFETSDLLTPGEIADCLAKRLAKVKANLERIKEIYATGKGSTFKKTLILKMLLYFREAEENFLKEVLQEL